MYCAETTIQSFTPYGKLDPIRHHRRRLGPFTPLSQFGFSTMIPNKAGTQASKLDRSEAEAEA